MDNENTNDKQTRKTRSGIVIFSIVAAAFIVLAVLWSPVISPALQYLEVNKQISKANNLISKGEYQSARIILRKLVDEEEIPIKKRLEALGSLKKSEVLYYTKHFQTVKVGDIVKFGTYEQDGDFSNGKEDITWLVLAKESNKVLLISKNALACKRYNNKADSVTWESCSLRKWLNDSFLHDAFSAGEQAMVQDTYVTADENPYYITSPGNATSDKVFLLSISDADKYFGSKAARICVPTDYASASGGYCNSKTGACWWWLRSPGSYNNYEAAYVEDDGSYDSLYVIMDSFCVRPALWIDLER